MIYYGWPKVRDPKKDAADFEAMGFKPGVVRGTALLLVEFGGASRSFSASTRGRPPPAILAFGPGKYALA
jgi:hypothetical protein